MINIYYLLFQHKVKALTNEDLTEILYYNAGMHVHGSVIELYWCNDTYDDISIAYKIPKSRILNLLKGFTNFHKIVEKHFPEVETIEYSI